MALFSFNVLPEELEAAHALLDKQAHRRAMRVTYNENYNFVIKYMPGGLHERTQSFFIGIFRNATYRLTGPIVPSYGYRLHGAQKYHLNGGLKKEPDQCIVPAGALSPSITMEVGCSESITQLQGDARRWLKLDLLDVKMVIIISIDSPIPPNLTPRITIEHWKSGVLYGACHVRSRKAHDFWQGDGVRVLQALLW